MIDNLTIRTKCNDQEFIRLTERLSLIAPIDSEKVRADWMNLRFMYYPNAGHLTLSNSLHKFFNLAFNDLIHAPVNHNDFSFADFVAVVNYLTEGVFEKSATDLIISSRFEFGLNIDTGNHRPFDLLSKYQTCVTTHPNEFFTVDPYRGKPIQRNCRFSDWYIKGYDKGAQGGIAKVNIMRFEAVITEMRKLRQILGSSSTSLHDVSSTAAWNRLFNFIMATYDCIRKIPEIENWVVPVEDINAIYGYCNKLMRGDLKRQHTQYYFELLNKKNKSIYEKYNLSDKNYHNVIRQRFIENYTRLMPVVAASGEFQYV